MKNETCSTCANWLPTDWAGKCVLTNKHTSPGYNCGVNWEPKQQPVGVNIGGSDDLEVLYGRALKFVEGGNAISIVTLQRRLRCSHFIAATIIERLKQEGVIE